MAEVEHDIDALEEKLRAALQEVKNLDNDLLEGVLEVIRLPGWRRRRSSSLRWG